MLIASQLIHKFPTALEQSTMSSDKLLLLQQLVWTSFGRCTAWFGADTSRDPWCQSGASRDPWSLSWASRVPWSLSGASHDPRSLSGASRGRWSQSGASCVPWCQSGALRDPWSRSGTLRDPWSLSGASHDPRSLSGVSRGPWSQSEASRGPWSQVGLHVAVGLWVVFHVTLGLWVGLDVSLGLRVGLHAPLFRGDIILSPSTCYRSLWTEGAERFLFNGVHASCRAVFAPFNLRLLAHDTYVTYPQFITAALGYHVQMHAVIQRSLEL
jgi:hypothetical protein